MHVVEIGSMEELYAGLIVFGVIVIIAIVANVSFRRKIDKICQPPDTDNIPKNLSKVKEDFSEANELLKANIEKYEKIEALSRQKRIEKRKKIINERKEKENEVSKSQSVETVKPTTYEIEEQKRIEEELAKRRQEEARQFRERAAQREREEIAQKILEKQRRRELEKQVRQELIDKGILFGDEAKRPPIPQEIVDAVYRRDKGRCVKCGSTQNLQLDHIIPFSKGGATSVENLQLLCQKCNLEKSNKIG